MVVPLTPFSVKTDRKVNRPRSAKLGGGLVFTITKKKERHQKKRIGKMSSAFTVEIAKGGGEPQFCFWFG